MVGLGKLSLTKSVSCGNGQANLAETTRSCELSIGSVFDLEDVNGCIAGCFRSNGISMPSTR